MESLILIQILFFFFFFFLFARIFFNIMIFNYLKNIHTLSFKLIEFRKRYKKKNKKIIISNKNIKLPIVQYKLKK